MENCIKKYDVVDMKDIKEVGYKNAAFGKMVKILTPKGVLTPSGFAVTVAAYRYFLSYNKLDAQLKLLMTALDKKGFSNLGELGEKARKLIGDGKMPSDLGMKIMDAYDYSFDMTSVPVAVRSSAINDHLADAAASGLNDSYLNVQGHGALLYAIRRCFVSTYNDRAIRHAAERGYDPAAMAMSVGVQEMIRADNGASGIGYTPYLESGSKKVIRLKAIWGLGELINHENIQPDKYSIFNSLSQTATTALIEKQLGKKHKMMIYADEDDETNQTVLTDTPVNLQQRFVLDDDEIRRLASWAVLIDEIYQQPMCFEWAKDGRIHQLYLLQVHPLKDVDKTKMSDNLQPDCQLKATLT